MKKLLIASTMMALGAAGLAAPAQAEVKIGVLLGFTGPIETTTPGMADGAELAIREVNESGLLLGGETVVPVRGDSTCIDSAAAVAAAERLVTSDNVAAIMGADCSGVTNAVANQVTIPNGVVMISPSATSPALSDIEDNGYFFRTAPSDARQGAVLADILNDRGITEIAVTYTNNDYGKGLADAFQTAFEATGGTVSISVPHEDGKGDYSAEVGALAASGSDVLAVFGYVDQGGRGVIQSSLDTGAFDMFVFGDGMTSAALTDNFGTDIEGSFGTLPGAPDEIANVFLEFAESMGVDGDGAFRAESYDAAALIMLAMQAAGSTDGAAVRDQVLAVANAPGEPIAPGELAKGLEILANGGEIDYVGATGVELIGPGEAAGSYRELEVQNGALETVQIR
jgi:branched-chain amino acid transport system substrate-binding protein